ncbi:MAG: insulinase family protein [Planctomycetes bacterium]|nr:insulinase family protein [Planctomycetota bacterium]
MTQPVVETILDNGLKVLTCEDHDVPVVSFWVWYRVGSRNERPGITGASHLVEHMLFKSGRGDTNNDIFRKVARVGGINNAFTSRDFTAYFETLPSRHLDLALRIERKRLEYPISKADFESERTVVLSEKDGSENHPHTLLRKALDAKAFRKHPYGRPIIGTRKDLTTLTSADLRKYFRRHYRPNCTVIVAVGDFDTAKLLRRLEKQWGNLRGGARPGKVVAEPGQRKERRVTVRRRGGAAYIEVLCKGPGGDSPDAFPLLVADALLGGSKSYIGDNATGYRTSRLYKALVTTGLASSAHSSFHPSIDSFGVSVGATAIDAGRQAKLERTVLRELERLAGKRPADEEVQTAVTQLLASHAYASESVTHRAMMLGYAEIVHTHKLLDDYADNIRAVTGADVQRAAERYLLPSNRTIGWFIPTEPSYAPEAPVEAGPEVFAVTGFKAAARVVTENGAAVLAARNSASHSVIVYGSMPGGPVYDTERKAGLAGLTATATMRGTKKRSYEEIFGLVDSVGASLSVSASLHNVSFHLKCLADHWPALLELMLEVLRQPSFPPEHVELIRNQYLTYLSQVADSPQHVAGRELNHLIYPPGHPYHHYPNGYSQSVGGLTCDDLRRFHSRHYSPNGSIFCVVGDVEADAAARNTARLIEKWRKKRKTPMLDLTAQRRSAPQKKVVIMKEKPQAEIALGFKAPARTHPDFTSLQHLTHIIGGLGLMGRLGRNIREEQGMAYYVYASYSPSMGECPWSIHAGVNPKNIDRTIESILDELHKIRSRKVTAGELNDSKGFLTGILPLKLETNEGRAAAMHAIEYYGLGDDYLDRYEQIIRSVTAGDILEAAKSHIDIDGYSAVVVRPE